MAQVLAPPSGRLGTLVGPQPRPLPHGDLGGGALPATGVQGNLQGGHAGGLQDQRGVRVLALLCTRVLQQCLRLQAHGDQGHLRFLALGDEATLFIDHHPVAVVAEPCGLFEKCVGGSRKGCWCHGMEMISFSKATAQDVGRGRRRR